MATRILTTHAGSLPRPKPLTQLHVRKFGGESVDDAEMESAIESAAGDRLDKQIASGVDIVNDGEVGREGFFTYVTHRMSGFGGRAPRPIMRDIVMYPTFLEYILKQTGGEQISLLAMPQAIGDVTYRDDKDILRECKRLRRLLDARKGKFTDSFMTAPSPGIVAAAMENKHYNSMSDYVSALARALAVEYKQIIAHGFQLQIDAPDLAMERHTLFADKPIGDFQDFVKIVVRAINEAIVGLPRERVRLHVCWGNYNGPHECDVPLAEIWPDISKAKVGSYVISLANPRHEHEVKDFTGGALPAGTSLIAGAIDTTTNYVEHPEVVATRIERAAKAVGDPARIIAGTDCGFETSAGYVMIAEEVVWAKLRALAAGAKIASHRLG